MPESSLIFTDLINDWEAFSKWTPEYLRERYGTIQVEITVDREADAYYEMNVEDHKRKILLGDFVDMVLQGGETNDYYMVANNHNLESEQLGGLLADIRTSAPFLNCELSPDQAFLIFGPAGTVTPLHHDTLNVLLAQVYGRKSVKLIPSNQLHLVYNNIGVFSDVDCSRPDYDRYPLFKEADCHKSNVGARRGAVYTCRLVALCSSYGCKHHYQRGQFRLS